LRDVELSDVDAYVRMRCDPAMMAELGGPLPREGIEDKVARDVRAAAAGTERAVRMLLEMARDDGRWGLVHAFPATSNAPSNGICRSLGFRFAGERDVTFADRVLQSNHWVINPATDLATR
jgi:RimJ/RimL family protein N-acetyltransferase